MLIFKYISYIILLVMFSCDEGPVFDNPLDDDNNPDYTEPETFILSDINNSVITESFLNIEFEGNDLVEEYAYNLNNQGWSDWIDQSIVTLSYLDEGDYNFKVKSRYITGDEDLTPAEVNFEVDAVSGPGLRIFPLFKTISNSSDMVSLYLEDVENISFGTITIQLVSNDCEAINISSIEIGDLLLENSNIFIYENEDNSHSINFGISEGNQLTGTGEIAKINLNNDGQSCNSDIQLIIDVENSELRDYDNQEIPIIDSANGVLNEN